MIKVLEKTGVILEMFREHKSLSLKEISESLGMKKPALHALLKSLQAIGYIEKTEKNRYVLGSKLISLLVHAKKDNDVLEIASQTVDRLSRELGEVVNFSIIRESRRCTVLKRECRQSVTVNDGDYQQAPFLETATGMVLLAYQEPSRREALLTFNAICLDDPRLGQLEAVRDAGVCVMRSSDGQAVYIAVAVFDASDVICGSIGCHIPVFRYEESSSRVQEELSRAAHAMHVQLKSQRDCLE